MTACALWLLLWQPVQAEFALSTVETIAWGLLVTGLLLVGGVAFGMSTRMLHIDKLALEVKARNSLAKQKTRLRRVINILSRYHKAYIALLVVYSIALSAVPAVLYSLYPVPWTCVAAWSLLIVIGHIVPLVWFTGPRELPRLSFFSPPLQFAIFLLTPIILPLSSLLDRFSSPISDSTFTLSHLKRSLFLHSEAVSTPSPATLTLPQLSMLHSLLDSFSLPVLLSMLPMDKVFSLSKDALMCEELVEEIGRRGFSRVPVTEGNRVIGVLHVSALLAGDRTRTVTLMQAGLTLQKPLFVQKDADLSAVLFTLLESKEQMAIIVDSSISDQLEDLSSPPALGIITQTDLMALILKVKKTPESTTPPSSSDMVSQDSLVIGKSRKGSYTAFDYEEMHSQDIRGTTDVERSGY